MRVATFIVMLCVGCFLVIAQNNCNCPGVNGWCNLNCTSSASCCGTGSMEPSCMTPGHRCCTWWLSAAQCADTDSCCGESGYGASSNTFCCGAGSSCCATYADGMSQCCGPKQQCCKGYNTFCCDAETEVCGSQDSMVCLPKNPITRNPHARPGQLEWAANLTSTWNIHAPLVVNSSFVAASGGAGTALVRVSDGAVTFILPPSLESPTLAAGRVIVSTDTQLVSYDLKLGKQSWSINFDSAYVGLVSHEHYLLAVNGSSNALNVFDARNGTLLYTLPSRYQSLQPVVSPYGTVAFAHWDGFVIFRLDSGKILTNATTTCYTQPPPLLAGSIFVSCNFVAYSARTGKQLWSVESSPEIQSIAATTKTVVGATQQHLYFVARSNGRIIKNMSIPYYESLALTGVGSEVLFAATNITAYNGTTGAQLWLQSTSEYGFQSAGTLHLGYVYLPAASDVYPAAMVAVDPTTGRVAASFGAGGSVSSPVFVDGRVLFMAADGLLYCGNAL